MARRPTPQERRLAALLAQLSPQMQAAFVAAMRAAAGRIDRRALEAAISNRDFGAIAQILRMDGATLFPVSEVARSAALAGAEATAAALPITIRGQWGFGGNPRAVEAVQRVVGDAIEGINTETLGAVREHITRAVAEGVPPRRIALDITGRTNGPGARRTGGILGLNSNQTDAAMRARHELANLDSSYFRRARRDRRYDSQVKEAIRTGKPLTPAQIDTISGRYNDRLLNLRGEMIARTETLNALRTGQHEGFAQLIDSGAVPRDRLTVTWQATRDARTRDAHAALGGTTILFGALFTSPTGAQLAHPGDASHGAGAADLVACRCAAVYRILTPKQAAERAAR